MDTRAKRKTPAVQYVPAAGPQKGPQKRHSIKGNRPTCSRSADRTQKKASSDKVEQKSSGSASTKAWHEEI